MIILGIETAVDDTGVAIVKDGWKIISTAIHSQIKIHAKTGGVIPEAAAREHLKVVIPLLNLVFEEGKINPAEMDAIAVSTLPGLLGPLLIGVETARTLSLVWQKPVVAVNDWESHALAVFLENEKLFHKFKSKSNWPVVYLIVSGGTSALFLAKYFGDYQLIGQTRDDAAGEAFDKSARLLGLSYPGGPAISKLADEFISKNPSQKLNLLPRPMLQNKSLDFSFSGLKTAVVREVKTDNIPPQELAAQTQEAIDDTLIGKALQAVKKYQPQAIFVGGGVAANKRLREKMNDFPIPFYFPPPKFCVDNAAMTAGSAYYYAKEKVFTPWEKLNIFEARDIKGHLWKY